MYVCKRGMNGLGYVEGEGVRKLPSVVVSITFRPDEESGF